MERYVTSSRSLRSSFSSKTVLVTGHTGFKGSWLSVWLSKLGANVSGIGLDPPSCPSHYVAAGIHELVDDRRIDIRNIELLNAAVDDIQPDYVFHLAAQSLVRESYASPIQTYQTNALGTTYLLEALRNLSKKCTVVLITSDKVYDNVEWHWGYRETDRLGGCDPYSGSKGAAELLIRSHLNSFFPNEGKIRIAVGRSGNVIGGGDWAQDRIVPDCIRSFIQGTPVKIRQPNSTRPWQHVLEPLSGYLVLAKELSEKGSLHGEAFNFGPKSEQNYTVGELVTKLSSYWNSVQNVELSEDHSSLSESQLLKLNCDKAQNILKWKTVLELDETIQFTGEWYHGFQQAPDNIRRLTENQIDKYSDLAVMREIQWAK